MTSIPPGKQGLGSSAEAALTANANDSPDLLYHYTTTEGLVGIVKSRGLFATDVQYMNDASELKYSFQLFDDMARELQKRDIGGSKVFVEQLQRFFSTTAPTITAFAACMCVDGDLLSQWRGYGAIGGGYALGFDVALLKEIGQRQRYDLYKVVYAVNDQRQRLERALNEQLNVMRGTPGARVSSDVMAFAGEVLSSLVQLKHPHFQEEREWRTVALASSLDSKVDDEGGAIEVRQDGTRLVPYRILSLVGKGLDFPLRRIVIGPRDHADLAHRALRLLLDRHGLERVEVVRSEIPLRT